MHTIACKIKLRHDPPYVRWVLVHGNATLMQKVSLILGEGSRSHDLVRPEPDFVQSASLGLGRMDLELRLGAIIRDFVDVRNKFRYIGWDRNAVQLVQSQLLTRLVVNFDVKDERGLSANHLFSNCRIHNTIVRQKVKAASRIGGL